MSESIVVRSCGVGPCPTSRPAGEEDALRESARVLNERMRVMREAGKTVGLEQLAVVTALNVMHEYLTLDSDKRDAEAQIQTDLARVEQKIQASLGRRSSAERVE